MAGAQNLMILATSAVVLLGFVLWFIVRRQKQRFWLPILRVIPLNLRVLPKLRWYLPVLWPLVCFALAALALIIYSLQLTDPLLKKEDVGLKRTHIFFDLSPSLAQSASPSEYASSAQKLVDAVAGNSRLSFSLSSGPEIYFEQELEQVSSLISRQNFHRAGVKLGSSVDQLLKQLTDVEHLIIVSDQDGGSWDDFNWRYLNKKMLISWYPMSEQKSPAENVFIDEVKLKSTDRGQLNSTWLISLRRTGQGQILQGNLQVKVEDRQLLQQDWNFDAETKNLEMEVSLASKSLENLNSQKANSLLWKISPSGPGDLLADNEFRNSLQAQGQEALVIAHPRGEMFLDDSVFHLQSSLEVLGYHVQRVDRLQAQKTSAVTLNLVVAEAAPKTQKTDFCPLFAAERSFKDRQNGDLSIWLVPDQDLTEYGELCHCFASLAQAPKPLLVRPAYCENLEHRDQFVGVLHSLGALQLGGAIDSPLGAMALSLRNKALGIRILGFTLPLNPMRTGQVSFGQLPLMLRAVLQLSGVKLVLTQNTQQNWLRLEDISQGYQQVDLQLSNVPMQESLGRSAYPEELPPVLQLGDKGLIRKQSVESAESDARPWIYLCLMLLVFSVWLEIIGFGISRVFKRHAWVLRWFVFLIALLCLPKNSLAGVRLNLLSYGTLPKLNLLQKEVAARTSIQLDENIIYNAKFQQDSLREPWLWVNQPQILENLDSSEWTQLMQWLQRGGFLIVENHSGAEKLKKAILERAPLGTWKPIPPDHELMRSFHLLVSLPQCAGQVWEGFHFDRRLAIILIPGDFLRYTLDEKSPGSCFSKFSHEQSLRVFINLLMVSLATDYKKDQIHLPEILKRLR